MLRIAKSRADVKWRVFISSKSSNNKHQLVGGWTNPFEKYARQIGFIFPKFRGENSKKYLSCHHPENLQILNPKTTNTQHHHPRVFGAFFWSMPSFHASKGKATRWKGCHTTNFSWRGNEGDFQRAVWKNHNDFEIHKGAPGNFRSILFYNEIHPQILGFPNVLEKNSPCWRWSFLVPRLEDMVNLCAPMDQGISWLSVFEDV